MIEFLFWVLLWMASGALFGIAAVWLDCYFGKMRYSVTVGDIFWSLVFGPFVSLLFIFSLLSALSIRINFSTKIFTLDYTKPMNRPSDEG